MGSRRAEAHQVFIPLLCSDRYHFTVDLGVHQGIVGRSGKGDMGASAAVHFTENEPARLDEMLRSDRAVKTVSYNDEVIGTYPDFVTVADTLMPVPVFGSVIRPSDQVTGSPSTVTAIWYPVSGPS